MDFLIPLDLDENFLDEINKLIATELSLHTNAHYIEAFNRDITVLNQYITEPPSKKNLFREGLVLEDENNVLMEASQQRWAKYQNDYEVGRNAIRNLAVLRAEYNLALKKIRDYDHKARVINELLAPESFAWGEIISMARKKNPKTLQAVMRLREDWSYQGSFALFQTDDLIHMLDEVYDFKWFLKLLIKAFARAKTESKILDVLILNKKTLKQWEKQIVAAMAWRIHASSLRKNLFFDDAYWALQKSLSQEFGSASLIRTQLPTFADNVSTNLDPEKFLLISKIVSNSQYDVDREKLFQSHWIQEKDTFFPLEQLGQNIIPKAVAPLIAQEKGYSPGNWIRYYFFNIKDEVTRFWTWIKLIMVGRPSHAPIILNEAASQISRLNEELNENSNLKEVIDHPGFKIALEINKVISFERQRANRFLMPFWMRMIFMIPGLNNVTQKFLDVYKEELDKVDFKIQIDAEGVASQLLEVMNKTLLLEIEERLFSFPKEAIHDIEHFIRQFGSPKSVEFFYQIINPVTLFKKFHFFVPNDSNPFFRSINHDAVDAFLRYSERYWGVEDQKAAQALMDIVSGLNYPRSKDDERLLYNQILFLFNPKTAKEDVKDLLEWIASKVVVRSADISNPFAYRFILKYASKAASIWTEKKLADLQEKFTKVNALFHKVNGEEVFLHSKSKGLNSAQVDLYLYELTLEQSYRKTMLEALMRRMGSYAAQYNGQSSFYLDLCFKISNKANDYEIVHNVATKRLMHLLKNPTSTFEDHELHFWSQFREDSKSEEIFRPFLESYQGDSLALLPLIESMGNETLRAIFLAKHFDFLIRKCQVSAFEEASHLFDPLKTNTVFVRKVSETLSQCYSFYDQGKIQVSALSGFYNETVESYAHQNVKESYRLRKLEQLFQTKDKSAIEAHLSKVKETLNNKSLIAAFKKESSIASLVKLFTERVEQMVTEVDWHGNWQFIIEHFPYPEVSPLIYKTRLAWFSEFVFKTDSFTLQGIEHRETQDLNMHFKNIEVPNDHVDLAEFFGSELSHFVGLVLKRIDDFSLDTDDSVLQILDHYFQDEVFISHSQSALYIKKLSLLKQVKKIVTALNGGLYDNARLFIDQLVDEYHGLRDLHHKDTHYKDLIHYYENGLTALESFCLETFRLLKFNLKKTSEQYELIDQSDAFEESLLQGRTFLSHQEEYEYLFKNDVLIRAKAKAMLESLKPTHHDNLDLTLDTALILHLGLSKVLKDYIEKRLNIIASAQVLDVDFGAGVSAFIEIMKRRPKKRLDSLSSKLRSYEFSRSQRGEIVQQILDRLIKKIQTHQSLLDEPLFKMDNESMVGFLKPASNEMLRLLRSTLYDKIRDFKELELIDLQDLRKNGECFAKLVHVLSSTTVLKSKDVDFVNEFVDEACQDATKAVHLLDQIYQTLFVVNSGLKNDIERKVIEVLEQKALKASLMITLFGKPQQKIVLEDLIGIVSLAQRHALLSFKLDPITEHCIDFTFNFIQNSSDPKRRSRNMHLKETWSIHQGNPSDQTNRDLHHLAFIESIPQYSASLQRNFLSYFANTYNLNTKHRSESFSLLISDALSTFKKEKKLLVSEDILSRYDSNYFQKILEKAQGKRSILESLTKHPNQRSGQKLFVLFCLLIRAQQLSEAMIKRLEDGSCLASKEWFQINLEKPLLSYYQELDKELELYSRSLSNLVVHSVKTDEKYFVSWDFSALKKEAKKESLIVVGAGGETRTRTLLPIPDFESGASTNSTTPATSGKYSKL